MNADLATSAAMALRQASSFADRAWASMSCTGVYFCANKPVEPKAEAMQSLKIFDVGGQDGHPANKSWSIAINHLHRLQRVYIR